MFLSPQKKNDKKHDPLTKFYKSRNFTMTPQPKLPWKSPAEPVIHPGDTPSRGDWDCRSATPGLASAPGPRGDHMKRWIFVIRHGETHMGNSWKLMENHGTSSTHCFGSLLMGSTCFFVSPFFWMKFASHEPMKLGPPPTIQDQFAAVVLEISPWPI